MLRQAQHDKQRSYVKIANVQQIPAEKVEMDGAKDCKVQLAVTPRDGAPNFAMRIFEVAPGGHTPLHHHPYEHEIYVMEGRGTIWRAGQEEPINPGDVLYIPACLLYTSPSPRDRTSSRMPSS